jgi:hypothetical protein
MDTDPGTDIVMDTDLDNKTDLDVDTGTEMKTDTDPGHDMINTVSALKAYPELTQ